MTSHRTTRTGLGLGAALALAPAAPAGAFAAQDLRSPDTRDRGSPTAFAQPDPRSPHRRHGAARARRPVAPARGIAVSPSEGFDWGDAAIGAGGAAGLVLVLAGAGTARTRRRIGHTAAH